jgi:hypothetical protein
MCLPSLIQVFSSVLIHDKRSLIEPQNRAPTVGQGPLLLSLRLTLLRGSDYTNKTPVMPFIPTKPVACMSMSWLLSNVNTAKSCKGKKRDPDALELGLVS